jgi:lipopolysaccharide export system permease protein
MTRLSFYVLRQLIAPVALFTFLLTSVIWLSQSLRLLDLVINRGQSAPIFVYLTILILPRLLVIILPIAFFAGALFGLHKLNADSELVVMSAAGFSRRQLLTPVLMTAAILMALTYLCSLWLMPLGQRLTDSEVVDIRADIGAAILTPGEFNTPAGGLTVFIGDLSTDGHITGIFVHDSRNPQRPTTYIAKSGLLAQTRDGARLIMIDGTIEQSSLGGANLSVLKFKQYIFDLDQFASAQVSSQLETSERYLPELLWPGSGVDKRVRNAYFAEANNRLAAPLYCIAFAFIAFAAITRGRGGRGAYALRLTAACVFTGVLRIIGYGAQGAAARSPIMCLLLYAIPLAGAALAMIDIAGIELKWPSAARAPMPEPAA